MSVAVLNCLSLLLFKQKAAYERRVSDWSSDVCSTDLVVRRDMHRLQPADEYRLAAGRGGGEDRGATERVAGAVDGNAGGRHAVQPDADLTCRAEGKGNGELRGAAVAVIGDRKSTRLNSSH